MSIKPNTVSKLEKIKPCLVFKSRLVSCLRSFFEQNSFIEIDTPLLIDAPAPEEYIEAPSVGDRFLRTSPELQMKQMLAAGYENIYQLGSCFREGEFGRLHRPEFTMLEWYEAGIDYLQLKEFTCNMIGYAVEQLGSDVNCNIDFDADWEMLSVHKAFEKYANTTLEQAIEKDIFEEVLVDKIEPNLGVDIPTILIDYPVKYAAFSRVKKSNPLVAERWELYLNGVEIANAYSELVDPSIQRQRFDEFTKTRKETGFKEYPEPVEFLEAIDYGIPESAGCALGVDRLAMVLSGNNDISNVVFPS